MAGAGVAPTPPAQLHDRHACRALPDDTPEIVELELYLPGAPAA